MKNSTLQQAGPSRPVKTAPAELRRKTCDGRFKSLDDSGPGEFTFYAAVFGNVDRDGDVIEPGAFKNLDEFVKDGFVSFNHDWQSLPVAYPVNASQDATGLLITARFHSTPEAQACRTVARERLAAGKAVKCSIGYRVMDSSTETRGGQRVNVLKALAVYEAGMVNIPANPSAEVGSVKGVVSLDQAQAMLARYKDGRVLSTDNHKKLNQWAKDLHGHGKTACAMAKDVLDWLRIIDPDNTDYPDEFADVDDYLNNQNSPASQFESEQGDKRTRLRLRATWGRTLTVCP